MFSRGVKIFSSVSCWFKPRLIAGWELEPVVFNTVLDDRNPSARYVTVPLNRRTAKSIRCRFFFADIWMMFSEISFQSGNAHAENTYSIIPQPQSYIPLETDKATSLSSSLRGHRTASPEYPGRDHHFSHRGERHINHTNDMYDLWPNPFSFHINLFLKLK